MIHCEIMFVGTRLVLSVIRSFYPLSVHVQCLIHPLPAKKENEGKESKENDALYIPKQM